MQQYTIERFSTKKTPYPEIQVHFGFLPLNLREPYVVRKCSLYWRLNDIEVESTLTLPNITENQKRDLVSAVKVSAVKISLIRPKESINS